MFVHLLINQWRWSNLLEVDLLVMNQTQSLGLTYTHTHTVTNNQINYLWSLILCCLCLLINDATHNHRCASVGVIMSVCWALLQVFTNEEYNSLHLWLKSTVNKSKTAKCLTCFSSSCFFFRFQFVLKQGSLVIWESPPPPISTRPVSSNTF